MLTKVCPYDGEQVQYRESSAAFYAGKDYGPIYVCPKCFARVGVNKLTGAPHGTVANGRLRDLRKRCYQSFDLLWREGRMNRGQAYDWLARIMGVDKDMARIGLFDEAQCGTLLGHLLLTTSEKEKAE